MGDAEEALRARAVQTASDKVQTDADAAAVLAGEIRDLRRELGDDLIPRVLRALRAARYPGGVLQQKRLTHKVRNKNPYGYGPRKNWATEDIATWKLFEDGYTFYLTSEGTFMTTGTVGGPSGYYQAGERCLALAEWPDFSDQKHVAELLKKARVRIVEMIDQLTTTA